MQILQYFVVVSLKRSIGARKIAYAAPTLSEARLLFQITLLKSGLRPVYTVDFGCDLAAIFAAISWRFHGDFTTISNRLCKLLAIPRRSESPVTPDDLKSRLESQQKSPLKSQQTRQCKRAFTCFCGVNNSFGLNTCLRSYYLLRKMFTSARMHALRF